MALIFVLCPNEKELNSYTIDISWDPAVEPRRLEIVKS